MDTRAVELQVAAQYEATHARLASDPIYQILSERARLEQLHSSTYWLDRNALALYVEQHMPGITMSDGHEGGQRWRSPADDGKVLRFLRGQHTTTEQHDEAAAFEWHPLPRARRLHLFALGVRWATYGLRHVYSTRPRHLAAHTARAARRRLHHH